MGVRVCETVVSSPSGGYSFNCSPGGQFMLPLKHRPPTPALLQHHCYGAHKCEREGERAQEREREREREL